MVNFKVGMVVVFKFYSFMPTDLQLNEFMSVAHATFCEVDLFKVTVASNIRKMRMVFSAGSSSVKCKLCKGAVSKLLVTYCALNLRCGVEVL